MLSQRFLTAQFLAKRAGAEREKRSKIVHAEGEYSAAQRLVDSAHLLVQEPVSIQSPYPQTLTEIGMEKNTALVFPVPVDIFARITKVNEKSKTKSSRSKLATGGRTAGHRPPWCFTSHTKSRQ